MQSTDTHQTSDDEHAQSTVDVQPFAADQGFVSDPAKLDSLNQSQAPGITFDLQGSLDRRAGVDRRGRTKNVIEKQIKPASEDAFEKLIKPQKDNWDKIGAIAPIISGTLIFLMGGWFTYTFNQQQLRLQEVQTIEKFIPHLMGNEQSKKAAILAISCLTDVELAGKFASIFASSGTISALQKISSTGTETEKSTATKALSETLESLAARDSKLTGIESAYKHALQSKTQNQSDDAYNMNKLAQIYTLKGQYSLAEPLFTRALQLRENLYGPDTPMVADTLKAMAEMYDAAGDSGKAESCLKRARSIEATANASGTQVAPAVTPTSDTPAPAQVSDKDKDKDKDHDKDVHPAASSGSDGSTGTAGSATPGSTSAGSGTTPAANGATGAIVAPPGAAAPDGGGTSHTVGDNKARSLSEPKSHLTESNGHDVETKGHLTAPNNHVVDPKSHGADLRPHTGDAKARTGDSKPHVSTNSSTTSEPKAAADVPNGSAEAARVRSDTM